MKETRKSKMISLLLAVIMVLGMLPLSAVSASAEPLPYSGKGTKESPFLVWTYDGLMECLNNTAPGETHIKLIQDLDVPVGKNGCTLTVAYERSVYLDLNGFTITRKRNTADDCLFFVQGNLLIYSSIANRGGVVFTSDKEDAVMFKCDRSSGKIQIGVKWHNNRYHSVNLSGYVRKEEYTYPENVVYGGTYTTNVTAIHSMGVCAIDSNANIISDSTVIFALSHCDIRLGSCTLTSKAPASTPGEMNGVICMMHNDRIFPIELNSIGGTAYLKRENRGNLIDTFSVAYNSQGYNVYTDLRLDGTEVVSLPDDGVLSGKELKIQNKYGFEIDENMQVSWLPNSRYAYYKIYLTDPDRFGHGENALDDYSHELSNRTTTYSILDSTLYLRILNNMFLIDPDTMQGFIPSGTRFYFRGWEHYEDPITHEMKTRPGPITQAKLPEDYYMNYYYAVEHTSKEPTVVCYPDGTLNISCLPAKTGENMQASYDYSIIVYNNKSSGVYYWDFNQKKFFQEDKDYIAQDKGLYRTSSTSVSIDGWIHSDAFAALADNMYVEISIEPYRQNTVRGISYNTHGDSIVYRAQVKDLRTMEVMSPPPLTKIETLLKTDLIGTYLVPGKKMSDYDFKLLSREHGDNTRIESISTQWTKVFSGTKTEVPGDTVIGSHERYYPTVTLTAKDGYTFDAENSRLYYPINQSNQFTSKLVSRVSVDGKTATFVLSQAKYWSYCNHSLPNTWEHSSVEHWKKCTICGEKFQIEDHILQEKQMSGELCKYCIDCGYTYTVGQIWSYRGAVIRQKPYAYGSIIPGNTLERVYCYDGDSGTLKRIEWYRSKDSSLGTKVNAGDLFEKGYNYYAKVTLQSDDPQMTFDADTKVEWEYTYNVNAEKIGTPVIESNGYTLTQTFKVPLREVAEINLTIPGMEAGMDVEQYVCTLLDSYSYNYTGSGTIGRARLSIYAMPMPGETSEQTVCLNAYYYAPENRYYVLLSGEHKTFREGVRYRIEMQMDHPDRSYDEDHFNLQNVLYLDTPALEYRKDACTADSTAFNVYYTPKAYPSSGKATVNGSFKSFGEATDGTTIKLFAQGTTTTKFTATKTGNAGTYSFAEVPAGTYRLEVSKKNHVTRAYTITVGSTNVTQNVEIWLYGDLNGSGTITMADYVKAYAHVKEVPGKELSGYEFKCADVNDSDSITMADYVKIYAHAKETKFLW